MSVYRTLTSTGDKHWGWLGASYTICFTAAFLSLLFLVMGQAATLSASLQRGLVALQGGQLTEARTALEEVARGTQ